MKHLLPWLGIFVLYTSLAVAMAALGHGIAKGASSDAALGRALRELAEARQAPQLLYGPRGWSCQLVCGGRELAFRETALEAVQDAEKAVK